MHRTAQRLKALLAMIMPNSNSLNSALRPDARCDEETIGVFVDGVEACAKFALELLFSVGITKLPIVVALREFYLFIESVINILPGECVMQNGMRLSCATY